MSAQQSAASYFPSLACFDGENIERSSALQEYFLSHDIAIKTNSKQLSSCMYHVVVSTSENVEGFYSRFPRPALRRLLITYNITRTQALILAEKWQTKVAVMTNRALDPDEAPVVFGFLCTGEEPVLELTNKGGTAPYFVETVLDNEVELINDNNEDLINIVPNETTISNNTTRQGDEERVHQYIKSLYYKKSIKKLSSSRIIKKTARVVLVTFCVLLLSHFLAVIFGFTMLYFSLIYNKTNTSPFFLYASKNLFNYAKTIYSPVPILISSKTTRNYERFLHILVNGVQTTDKLLSLPKRVTVLNLNKAEKSNNSTNTHMVIADVEKELGLLQQSLAVLNAEVELFISEQHKISIFSIPKPISSWLSIKFRDALAYTTTLNKLAGLYPLLAPPEGEKRYLLLFQNSNELRPTGGFIGSVGVLTINNGEILSLDVEDVYNIDGQLKGHVNPPLPIRTILNQEHWFLRDSNWDPDLEESGKKALWFYEKSTLQKLDGVIGVSLPLVENLLKVLGPLNIVGIQDEVDTNNFSQILHNEIEGSFFPGSTRKKDVLSEVSKTLISKLQKGNGSGLEILNSIHNGLASGALMMYSTDPETQEHIRQTGWGGVYAFPDLCNKNTRCVNDGLGIVEANLSVDKINKYITRKLNREIEFEKLGEVKTKDTITIENSSSTNNNTAGTYTVYMRLYYPKLSVVSQFSINDEVVKLTESSMSAKPMPYIEELKEKAVFNIYGLAFVVNPQEKAVIKIDSALNIQEPTQYAFSWLHQPGVGSVPVTITGSTTYDTLPTISQNKMNTVGHWVAKRGFFEYTTTMSANDWFVVDLNKHEQQ